MELTSLSIAVLLSAFVGSVGEALLALSIIAFFSCLLTEKTLPVWSLNTLVVLVVLGALMSAVPGPELILAVAGVELGSDALASEEWQNLLDTYINNK